MKKLIQFSSFSFLIIVGIGLYYFEFIDKNPNQSFNPNQSPNQTITQTTNPEMELPPSKIGENFAYVNQVRIDSTNMSQFNYQIHLSEIEDEINLKKINSLRQPASENKKSK